MIERLYEPIERIPEVESALMDLLMVALADEPTDRPTAARVPRPGLLAPVAAVDVHGYGVRRGSPGSTPSARKAAAGHRFPIGTPPARAGTGRAGAAAEPAGTASGRAARVFVALLVILLAVGLCVGLHGPAPARRHHGSAAADATGLGVDHADAEHADGGADARRADTGGGSRRFRRLHQVAP